MEDVLLAVMMLAVFAFGYFVVDRFGKFIDENSRGNRKPQEQSRKDNIAETGGRSQRRCPKKSIPCWIRFGIVKNSK